MSSDKTVKTKQPVKKSWKQQKRELTIIIIALSVLVVAALTFGVFKVVSWFNPSTKLDITVAVSDFKGEVYAGAAALTSNTNFVQSDLSALTLNVNFSSKGSSAYIRVKMFESFKNANGVIPNQNISYTLASGWVLHTDGYFYYTQPVRGNGGSQSIPFITASSGVTLGDGEFVCFDPQVETVQPDRAVEFFGVDPGTLASS